MSDLLKPKLMDAVKQAMRAGDKTRLGTLRLVRAAIQQREVDERIELDDTQVQATLDKMVKQRRESVAQYRRGRREDLATREEAEIAILREFMPEPLGEPALQRLIQTAIEQSGATTLRDMGQVMGILKPQVQGRADMAAVSAQVKSRLQ